MFSPADQSKLAQVLGETFDARTLAGQFNAVAQALAKAPRSDHSEALLKIYRAVLAEVSERQYRRVADKTAPAEAVEGTLRIIPSQRTAWRGAKPAAQVILGTSAGDITLHLANSKPFDRDSRLDRILADFAGQKVAALGRLWGDEHGLHLMLDDMRDLVRIVATGRKTAPARKPK